MANNAYTPADIYANYVGLRALLLDWQERDQIVMARHLLSRYFVGRGCRLFLGFSSPR
jgi:hypothetical protein